MYLNDIEKIKYNNKSIKREKEDNKEEKGMENKYNPKEFINKKEREFTTKMVNETLRYQKLYGFDIGKDNVAVDNEADAFRHTYKQAYLSLFYGGNLIAQRLGDYHENQGKKQGSDPRSMNMDLWNNQKIQFQRMSKLRFRAIRKNAFRAIIKSSLKVCRSWLC